MHRPGGFVADAWKVRQAPRHNQLITKAVKRIVAKKVLLDNCDNSCGWGDRSQPNNMNNGVQSVRAYANKTP